MSAEFPERVVLTVANVAGEAGQASSEINAAAAALGLVQDEDGWTRVDDGMSFWTLRDAVYDTCGLCDCSGESVAYMASMMREIANDAGTWDDGPREFFMNVMNALEFADHGSGVRASWLTSRGKAALTLLEHVKKG